MFRAVEQILEEFEVPQHILDGLVTEELAEDFLQLLRAAVEGTRCMREAEARRAEEARVAAAARARAAAREEAAE